MEYDRLMIDEHGFVKEEGSSYASTLQDRLINFAVATCRIAEQLPATRVGHHAAGQLIRSCTSPAPNYGEAQGAESRRDFIHKMKVCLKELRETHVWQTFIERMGLTRSQELAPLIDEADQLIAIFVRSVLTAEQNAKHRR